MRAARVLWYPSLNSGELRFPASAARSDAIATSRHFTATQHFGRFRTEADIDQWARMAGSVENEPQRHLTAVNWLIRNSKMTHRLHWRTPFRSSQFPVLMARVKTNMALSPSVGKHATTRFNGAVRW